VGWLKFLVGGAGSKFTLDDWTGGSDDGEGGEGERRPPISSSKAWLPRLMCRIAGLSGDSIDSACGGSAATPNAERLRYRGDGAA